MQTDPPTPTLTGKQSLGKGAFRIPTLKGGLGGLNFSIQVRKSYKMFKL
jgi:hypothetical protein